MTPLARRTAAVVVVYRADSHPGAVIDEARRQVGLTIVVDNSELGHPALDAEEGCRGFEQIHNRNRGGLAGAYNAAIDHLERRREAFDQIVFLDEDSDPSGLGTLLADPRAEALLQRPDTAAIAPAYVDRATGLRGRHIELGRWRLRHLPRVFEGVRRVAFVINSMSVWRLEALRRLGRFDEGLAIDHVDTEICLRARQAGLAVYVHGSHEFAHSIGERRRFTLFGREMQAGGHSPRRRWLIGRNTAWLARHQLWREPAFAWLCIARLAYETAGIVLAEDHRPAKLAALWRGALAGLIRRPGGL